VPAPKYRVDPKLKDFATESQKRCIDAVNEHRSYRRAAQALGVNYSSVQQAIAATERKAAMSGYAPSHDMTHDVPSPFVVKGTSTLYDDGGNLRLQWVKTQLDKGKAEEAIRDFIEWLVKDARGLAPAIQPPKDSNGDLLAIYPMGDPHFGMYSWAEETGEDFDTDIAESLTCAAIDRLVSSAPPAKRALILELGDFFHSDNNENRTLNSGNALDTDTRWARVMQIGLRAMIHCIKRACEKHEHVTVRIVKGNHDPHSSFALALALDAYFHGHDRVHIDLSPAAFWFYRFGKVLIGVTHGDTCKMRDLPGIMAHDRAEDWGQTKFRYWYQGHVHHESVEEFPGVLAESFRTLAAKDAWHAGQGYRAGRDMRLIVHHREFGEIERHRCDIAMIEKKRVSA
jgi:hypothetical protein